VDVLSELQCKWFGSQCAHRNIALALREDWIDCRIAFNCLEVLSLDKGVVGETRVAVDLDLVLGDCIRVVVWCIPSNLDLAWLRLVVRKNDRAI